MTPAEMPASQFKSESKVAVKPPLTPSSDTSVRFWPEAKLRAPESIRGSVDPGTVSTTS